MKVTDFKFKKVILSILAALLLTGCSVGNRTKLAKEKGREDQQTVIIAVNPGSEPEEGFNPVFGASHGTLPLFQSTLVTYDAQMQIQKDLATDYSVSEDGKTWDFLLREDAKFTDGQPVTPKDVVFTLEQVKASASAVDLTMIDKVATEGQKITVTLKEPQATFLNTIATLGIVPAHLYDENYGEHPIGSGPFKFIQWNKGEQIIMVANESYYGEVPAIKKVTIAFMEEDAALAAAKAGEVDIALVAATQVGRPIEGMNLKQVKTQDNRGVTLPIVPNRGEKTTDGYAIGNDVTSDLAIRKALVFGLDREKMAQNTVNGYASPAFSENDGMPWNHSAIKVNTDIEKAKEILATANWKIGPDGILMKDNLKAEFDLLYVSGDSVRQALAMDVALQAEELGIKINVRGSNWDEISKEMFSNAVLMGWGSSNPQTSYLLFHSDNKLKDDFYNPEGFDNPTVDHYLDSAMQATTTEEMNEYFKKAQWDGTTGTSMLGDAPWVWLVNIDHLYYVSDGLDIGQQAIHPHGAAWPLVSNLKEWKWANAQ